MRAQTRRLGLISGNFFSEAGKLPGKAAQIFGRLFMSKAHSEDALGIKVWKPGLEARSLLLNGCIPN
jgi:hypothetical protein